MPNNMSFANIDFWRTSLGLLPVPLFRDKEQDKAFVLMNGTQGNFCLDFGRPHTGEETRSFAWSSNVDHYVALGSEYVEVQRWDRKGASLERYSGKSVYENLEQFHAYLEKDSPGQGPSIIAHTIRVFRSLRSVLGNDFDGAKSLKAFLYPLGCATDCCDRSRLLLTDWGLAQEAKELALAISGVTWDSLRDELLQSRPIENLVPNLDLLLRHAAGQLFQEAHYETIFIPQNQLTLNGLLPSPIKVSKESKGIGLHFTPPALARTLAEEAFTTLGEMPGSVVVFDPACGSGEFLREALRQVRARGYDGQVRLMGWDISPAACDMANFALAWERREFGSQVSVEIECLNSLDPSRPWPSGADVVLMNPPFVSWEVMAPQQREMIRETLDQLTTYRPDLSHAFLWKAASCLRRGGVVASILPASFLEATSAAKLRKQLGDHLVPQLIARLGSHQLFADATVDAAFYIAKSDSSQGESPVAFSADYRSSSTSAGLRALRKVRYLPHSAALLPIIGDGFGIYRNPAIGRGDQSWSPRPYDSWRLLQKLVEMPRVRDLFEIRQGIRTGFNKAFLLDKEAWEILPKQEQRYFKPAVVNRSVRLGTLTDAMYVFYPYGANQIDSEARLQKVVREYYKTYLSIISTSCAVFP